MNHCFNIERKEIERYKRLGYRVGRPKSTSCMTVEQLEANDLFGVYENVVPVSAAPVAATTSTESSVSANH